MKEQVILERLTILETEWKERWMNHDKAADERQRLTCEKLDGIKSNIREINQKVDKLPCEKESAKLDEIDQIKKTATGLLITVVLGIIGFAVAWGMARNQIMINSERLNILESDSKQAQVIRSTNVVKINEIERRLGIDGKQK